LVFFIPLVLYGQIEPLEEPPEVWEFPYVLSFSASLGVKYGIREDFVYRNSGALDKLQQLNWDLKPLFVWGAALDFSRRNPMEDLGFFIRMDLQAALPGKTGEMEEGIWEASGNISQFSSHDNFVDGAWFLDLTTGISIPILSRVYLRLYAGLSYMKFTCIGQEGYRQFSNSSNVDFYGPVITYSQTWLIFSGGLSAHYPFLRLFNLGVSFQISPLIISDFLDDHLIESFQYTGDMFGGLFLEPRGELVFSPTKRIDLSLSFSYRLIQGSRGTRDTRNIKTDTVETATHEVGASIAFIDTGFTLTLHF
jgi:outer membrane protease